MKMTTITICSLVIGCLALAEGFWSLNPTYHICRAWGDPHYHPYDGGVIDFQGICRYLLTGTCPCSALDPFHVYVENEIRSWWSLSVSWTKLVETHYNDWIVQFNKNGIVHVRDQWTSWSYNVAPMVIPGVGTITKPYWNHMVFVADNGIQVEYKDDELVYVHAPCKFEDEMCGICGNMNNVFDDYVTSYGVDVTYWSNMNSLIGNSWQVFPAPWSNLSDICYNETIVPPQDFVPSTYVATYPCDKMSDIFECAELVYDFYAACVYDMRAATGINYSHCSTVHAFIDSCEERTGRDLRSWREWFNCPCPDGSFDDPCPQFF